MDNLLEQYNDMVTKVNAMSDEELDNLIKQGKCPYQPELLLGQPIGQHHCHLCGEMQVAGIKHLPSDLDINKHS